MLILPEKVQREINEPLKEGIRKQFNELLEKTLNEHKHVDHYWILGKLRFLPETDFKVGKIFLERSDQLPSLVYGTFVYFVDNRKGTKELLWTIDNQGNMNVTPTGKTFKAVS